MDPKILELRIQKWIPLIQEQANSGLNKKEWCSLHGIERTSFFRWQKRVRSYLLEQQSLGGTELPVLKQDRDDENFVELPTTQVTLAGAYHTQNNYPSGGSDYPYKEYERHKQKQRQSMFDQMFPLPDRPRAPRKKKRMMTPAGTEPEKIA
jgi:hypothetical protein